MNSRRCNNPAIRTKIIKFLKKIKDTAENLVSPIEEKVELKELEVDDNNLNWKWDAAKAKEKFDGIVELSNNNLTYKKVSEEFVNGTIRSVVFADKGFTEGINKWSIVVDDVGRYYSFLFGAVDDRGL